eukprot:351943-Chlamydomonas_euryale.AAC.14
MHAWNALHLHRRCQQLRRGDVHGLGDVCPCMPVQFHACCPVGSMPVPSTQHAMRWRNETLTVVLQGSRLSPSACQNSF